MGPAAWAAESSEPPPSTVSVAHDLVYATADGEPVTLDAYAPTGKTKGGR